MIAFILIGASFLTVAMGYTGIPRSLAAWIGEQGYSHFALLRRFSCSSSCSASSSTASRSSC
jgi:hypothetical protein